MQINLTQDLAELVAGLVVSGRFASENEAVGEGLRLLAEREAELEFDEIRAVIEQKIASGLADAAAGRLFTPEEAWAELEARRLARKRS